MFHPLGHDATRRRATIEIMNKTNLGRFAARRKAAELTDEQIESVVQAKCAAAGVALPQPAGDGFGAIGDGTIIQAIKDLCDAHPELIKIIMAALLALIGL